MDLRLDSRPGGRVHLAGPHRRDQVAARTDHPLDIVRLARQHSRSHHPSSMSTHGRPPRRTRQTAIGDTSADRHRLRRRPAAHHRTGAPGCNPDRPRRQNVGRSEGESARRERRPTNPTDNQRGATLREHLARCQAGISRQAPATPDARAPRPRGVTASAAIPRPRHAGAGGDPARTADSWFQTHPQTYSCRLRRHLRRPRVVPYCGDLYPE